MAFQISLEKFGSHFSKAYARIGQVGLNLANGDGVLTMWIWTNATAAQKYKDAIEAGDDPAEFNPVEFVPVPLPRELVEQLKSGVVSVGAEDAYKIAATHEMFADAENV